jgi:hypothetical protein
MMFLRVVASALVLTLIAYFTGSSFIGDLTALAWFSVVCFVALALVAVGEGYISEESLLPVRLPQRRPLAAAPFYEQEDDEYAPQYEPVFASEYYDPDVEEEWQRESPRRALG